MAAWLLTSAVTTSQRHLCDLLFPPVCLSCGSVEELPPDGISLCEKCRVAALLPATNFCPRCAMPVEAELQATCADCAEKKYHFSRAQVLHQYQGTMRELVLRMKHASGESLALAAGKWLGRQLLEQGISDQVDVVVPIPMHWLSRLWRGYHAADAIADACARELKVACRTDLLLRRRWRPKQATLTRPRRLRNMRSAFGVSLRYRIPDCRVLIVDDVITTGSTMNYAAAALRSAGASEVLVAAIARGTGY